MPAQVLATPSLSRILPRAKQWRARSEFHPQVIIHFEGDRVVVERVDDPAHEKIACVIEMKARVTAWKGPNGEARDETNFVLCLWRTAAIPSPDAAENRLAKAAAGSKQSGSTSSAKPGAMMATDHLGAPLTEVALGQDESSSRRAFHQAVEILLRHYRYPAEDRIRGLAGQAPRSRTLFKSAASAAVWMMLGGALVTVASLVFTQFVAPGKAAGAAPLSSLGGPGLNLAASGASGASGATLSPQQQDAVMQEAMAQLQQALAGFAPGGAGAGTGLGGSAQDQKDLADLLRSAQQTQVGSDIMARVAKASHIKDAASAGKKDVYYVFEDPLCSACRQFHTLSGSPGAKELAKHAIPVSFQDGAKSVVLGATCGKSGEALAASWSEVMKGKSASVPDKTDCSAAEARVNDNNRLFAEAGFRATPMLVAPNGAISRGAPPNEQALLNWVRANQSGKKIIPMGAS